MIGLDTNVLVRYFTQDDPVQTSAAVRVVEEVLSQKNRGFISSVVLCELVWLLRKVYRQSKECIADVLDKLFKTEVFEIQHRQCAVYAAYDYRNGVADFSDYYLAEIGYASGCRVTATFDKKASEHPLFESVNSILNKEQ